MLYEVITVGLSELSEALSELLFFLLFEAEKAPASIRALQRAAGFLRSRLGQRMRIRNVPELHFRHDDSVETGMLV